MGFAFSKLFDNYKMSIKLFVEMFSLVTVPKTIERAKVMFFRKSVVANTFR